MLDLLVQPVVSVPFLFGSQYDKWYYGSGEKKGERLNNMGERRESERDQIQGRRF